MINFENISASYDYKKDFSKVIINRNNKYCEMVMRWCSIFLLNKSFTTFSGIEQSQSLLFPMEKLFESYIASMLRKYIYANGSTSDMSVQDRTYYLFDEPRAFSLRPDIVITREDKTTVVLDTKWNVLVNNPYKNYGISQMDMYQMYAYSKKYNTGEIYLLYPINDDLKVGFMPNFYSEDGQDIYFIGRKYKKDLYAEGIFKVNSNTEKIEEVFLLPYVDTNSNDHKKYSGIIGDVANYYIFEDGNKVMFSGTIEGVDGTYIYNVEDNKFYNVIPHTVTAEEGSYVSSAWLSPDKTKVIYMNRAIEDYEEHWNLYAANVNGNSLTNRMCIYKDINLCGENIVWSPDSKKILFFTADEERMINYVPFPNKNEINIITFK